MQQFCDSGLHGVPAQVPAYAAKGRFHKGGANVGLRAYGVGLILPAKEGAAGKKGKAAGSSSSVSPASLPLVPFVAQLPGPALVVEKP